MKNYQKRVIKEKEILDINILEIDLLLKDKKLLSMEEVNFMEKQLDVMLEYSNILEDRICLFNKK